MMGGANATTDTMWLWTELTESMHPTRLAGTPVYEIYRQKVPSTWLEKGYVREARPEEMPEGQTDLFDYM